jgi:hypothetical protein
VVFDIPYSKFEIRPATTPGVVFDILKGGLTALIPEGDPVRLLKPKNKLRLFGLNFNNFANQYITYSLM